MSVVGRKGWRASNKSKEDHVATEGDFFHIHCIVYSEYVSEGQTQTEQFCVTILETIRAAIYRVKLERQ